MRLQDTSEHPGAMTKTLSFTRSVLVQVELVLVARRSAIKPADDHWFSCGLLVWSIMRAYGLPVGQLKISCVKRYVLSG